MIIIFKDHPVKVVLKEPRFAELETKSPANEKVRLITIIAHAKHHLSFLSATVVWVSRRG
jgi:hypothetical protein